MYAKRTFSRFVQLVNMNLHLLVRCGQLNNLLLLVQLA